MQKQSILKLSDLESRELIPGTEVRFVHSANVTLAYWAFEAGVQLPEHSHPHEQITNIIDGVFELAINRETHRLEPGAVAMVPPNALHAGKAITKCRIIDVFFPVRDDYR